MEGLYESLEFSKEELDGDDGMTFLERVLKKYEPLPDEVADKFLNRSVDKGAQ